MKNAAIFAALLLSAPLIASPSYAVTTSNATYVCPIGGASFKSQVFMSFTMDGIRLDTRPVYLGSPQILPLPECPDNGFVLYKDEFSEDELRKAKKVIETDHFKAIRRDNVSAARAAYIAENIGDDPMMVAFLYLQATWEAEDSGWPTEKVEAYISKSLSLLENYLATAPSSDDSWRVRVLAAELARRIGHFETALEHLASFAFDGANPDMARLKIVAAEIRRLAQEQNRSPAMIPGH